MWIGNGVGGTHASFLNLLFFVVNPRQELNPADFGHYSDLDIGNKSSRLPSRSTESFQAIRILDKLNLANSSSSLDQFEFFFCGLVYETIRL